MITFSRRESNPGCGGESAESLPLDHVGCSLDYRISYRNNIARRFQYFVTSNLPIILMNYMIVDFAKSSVFFTKKNLDVFLKYKRISILAYMFILFCFVCLFVWHFFHSFSLKKLENTYRRKNTKF